METVSGIIVDPLARQMFSGHLRLESGRITTITRDERATGPFILPGFIDSHIHIESSMLSPAAFAAQAVVHGTVAVVADPHEIANVLGIPGIDLMIANANQVPLKFAFGAPSCVPSTNFESSGATINAQEVDKLLQREEIYFLAEMMNFPGVLAGDQEVMAKIAAAQRLGKVVDGHATWLKGDGLAQYIQAGISTDHESTSLAECQEKLALGMYIQLRQGSSARNFADLHAIISTHPRQTMFCTDDLKPADLCKGHINTMVQQARQYGHDLFDILQGSSVNPVHHYKLPVGLLQPGDPADFILVTDLETLEVQATYIAGQKISQAGQALFSAAQPELRNNFSPQPLTVDDLQLTSNKAAMRVITVEDGQLITGSNMVSLKESGVIKADPQQDILKIVVQNRFSSSPPALAFIKGFGLQSGAMASSIAHDCHNIIAVGCSDEDISMAINLLHQSGGGIAFCSSATQQILPLPLAGIMGLGSCQEISQQYDQLEKTAQQHGCQLQTPFMTMSFLALPVIPSLKLTDQGLFDVDNFCFTNLFC